MRSEDTIQNMLDVQATVCREHRKQGAAWRTTKVRVLLARRALLASGCVALRTLTTEAAHRLPKRPGCTPWGASALPLRHAPSPPPPPTTPPRAVRKSTSRWAHAKAPSRPPSGRPSAAAPPPPPPPPP